MLNQAVLTTDSGQIRVFFDEFGQPKRIQDERSGEFTTATPIDRGLRFDTYSSSGNFVGGIAVMRAADGTYAVAPVLGSPALSGQVIGQLSGTLTGSFSVTPVENAGLGQFTPLPPALQAYLQANSGSKSLLSGLESIAEVAAESYLVLGAVAGGAVLVAGGPVIAAGAVAASTAALVGFGTALTASLVRDGIVSARQGIPEGEGRDMFDSLFGTYAGSMTTGQIVQNAVDEVRSVLETGRSRLNGLPTDVADFVTSAGNAAQDSFAQIRDFATQAAPVDMAPVVATDVEGFGVDSQSRSYTYSGQIAPDGSIAMTGQSNGGSETINVNGRLDQDGNFDSGTYSTNTGGGGNVTGSREDFGECAVVQQSGGQGTFSFSHDVGREGVVQFSRQAFNIPDAFDVFNAGSSVYSTGGLVSGVDNVSLPVSSRFVSVNVSAPQDGTLWEYELGCAQ